MKTPACWLDDFTDFEAEDDDDDGRKRTQPRTQHEEVRDPR